MPIRLMQWSNLLHGKMQYDNKIVELSIIWFIESKTLDTTSKRQDRPTNSERCIVMKHIKYTYVYIVVK